MATVLETRSLDKRFDAVVAAADISVVIEEGEVVGIIGANGAGKTTFINMVTGYLTPSSGTIAWRGSDITGLPPRRVTRLGICRSFQIPQLFLGLSALDNLIVALSTARGRWLTAWRPLKSPDMVEEAQGTLARFGIEAYAHHEAATLPQGIRKLLDIAMAVVGRPSLVLLDEPTSGISTDEKFPLMDRIMAALAGERLTVLFVEHDMEIVERYARRVLAFYDGRVITDGPTAEALASPEVRRYVIGGEIHRPARAGQA
jgi:branched-chain amino acid transport system ATP-binding protein